MSREKALEFIDQFEEHYKYDCDYMREMLKTSPDGFKAFEGFLPMGRYKKATPIDVIFVAKLAAMKSEDCGACTQLNIRMAIEAGVPKDILKCVMNNGEGLSEELKDVYNFSVAVATNSVMPDGLYEKMESRYSREVIVELGLAIASTKVYPTIKRALGYAKSCALYEFKF